MGGFLKNSMRDRVVDAVRLRCTDEFILNVSRGMTVDFSVSLTLLP